MKFIQISIGSHQLIKVIQIRFWMSLRNASNLSTSSTIPGIHLAQFTPASSKANLCLWLNLEMSLDSVVLTTQLKLKL